MAVSWIGLDQKLADQGLHQGGAQRLGKHMNVWERPQRGGARFAGRAHDQDRHFLQAVFALDDVEELEAVEPRHVQVEDDDVGAVLGEMEQGEIAIARDLDLDAGYRAGKRFAIDRDEKWVVLDDEGLAGRAGGGVSGHVGAERTA